MRLKFVAILCVVFFILGVISGVFLTYEYFSIGNPSNYIEQPYNNEYSGTVTEIIDGDTIEIDGQRIRLALVDTPERGEAGFDEATFFTTALCPIGSAAQVDIDDGQQTDKYGRIVAVVYCDGRNLNAELYENGLAEIDERFVAISEFDPYSWT